MRQLELNGIEAANPELIRLRDKLARLDDWLDDQEPGTEQYAKRQDVWFSTERRYRQVYDQVRLERSIDAVREAEGRYQERMFE
jgi:tRNA A37 N6-isopentenylltransferase MiaA